MRSQDSQVQVLVVGGGVIGLMSALRLAERGSSVTLLERAATGQQASWAGGGILAPLPPWQAAEAVWQLARQSLAEYPALCAELRRHTGIDPEWRQTGMLLLDAVEQAQGLDWCADQGLAADVVQASACEPALRGGQAALRLPWVAQLRNPRLCQALRLRVQQLGVSLRENCGSPQLRVQGGRASVQLGDETLHADAIVAATGAWTGEWLAATGWVPPIAPIAGQMLLLKGPPGLLCHVILQEGRYLIPRADGHILVGSTLEDCGFAKPVTAEVREELLAFAVQLLPAAASLPVVAHWAGLRPGSPQGIPFIQRHPLLENLFVNAGHFRYGLTMAPASATRLADLISAS